MGELTVRRNRGFAVPPRRETARTEKSTGGGEVKRPTAGPGATISETLRQRLDGQAETLSRVSRRTLQTGQAALEEVQERLGRLAELAREAAGGESGREDLQRELTDLQGEIDRILEGTAAGGTRLFLDGGGETGGWKALLSALGDAAPEEAGSQTIPAWLIGGLRWEGTSPERLLAALGLDKNASGADILAAVTGGALENNSAAGYLAALYLGAVIAGGAPPNRAVTPEEAMEGLRRLMEEVAAGVPVDQAVMELTDGAFTGFSDFQSQFSGGTAPGMQAFLEALLLTGQEESLLPGPLAALLLAGVEGIKLELLMGLLTTAQNPANSSEADPETGLEAAGTGGAAQAADPEAEPGRAAVRSLGDFQVVGRDLSGVSFDETSGTLTLGGGGDVTVLGVGRGEQTVLITGSGRVTLLGVDAAALAVDAPQVRIVSAGENTLGEVRLGEGVTLVLSGGGSLRTGAFRGGEGSVLHLTGGAVTVTGRDGTDLGPLNVPVVVEGLVSLAARAIRVADPSGKKLEPFDILWKTMLPGWSGAAAVSLDGRQGRLALAGGHLPALARLWLEKGDPSHGYALHTLALRGRDSQGRPRTRYAYLHWSQYAGTFEEVSMYPNPFTVTGGEENRDWVYEEGSHTLRILSSRVTAVSGGAGTDAKRVPFSGRIALADRIGGVELTLGGVVCRVSAGRAFDLGRANRVALLLRSGTDNLFESGAGCAGISLGEGTSLHIDRAEAHSGDRSPAGTLTAAGGDGGAGIGRDSGRGDRISRILIRGGVIAASGAGGGAGIGAGKRGAVGAITILGGTIASTGGPGGGAGIGGALGGPAGDISIRGGTVTASAVHHAAAIGAGVQGNCGDIQITGTARIAGATGGNPGADIGACLFGTCGEVTISEGVDLGSARLWTRAGIALGAGEATLPQFRLSAGALGLDGLNLGSREGARAAVRTVDADRRWVARIQAAYQTLHDRLERPGETEPLRDRAAADTLLRDVRRSIPLPDAQALRTHDGQGIEDVRQLLR